MIFTVVIYGGLFALFLRVLPWIVRRHPKARNLAALVVEGCAAWAAANALALIASFWDPRLRPDARILNALLSAIFAFGAHYLGSNTAMSPQFVYIPFFLLGLFMLLLGSGPLAVVVGIGLFLIGAVVGLLKYQDLRSQKVTRAAREAPQA